MLSSSYADASFPLFHLGSGFNPLGVNASSNSECSQFHWGQNNGNPYNWNPDPTYDAVCDVVSLDFFTSEGEGIEVAGLDSNSTVTIYFPCALLSKALFSLLMVSLSSHCLFFSLSRSHLR